MGACLLYVLKSLGGEQTWKLGIGQESSTNASEGKSYEAAKLRWAQDTKIVSFGNHLNDIKSRLGASFRIHLIHRC